ncbi:signal recognition particle-docking protein FtsY [Furfurilactobacillus entadae]|uniref:signal recognition particle-docking protein FtsY n=1 Tax=Furfurilactobacillus entadae TaxID=2922307 RepID=UPI0035EC4EE3
MGLFDIFRRRNAAEKAATSAAESSQAASEAESATSVVSESASVTSSVSEVTEEPHSETIATSATPVVEQSAAEELVSEPASAATSASEGVTESQAAMDDVVMSAGATEASPSQVSQAATSSATSAAPAPTSDAAVSAEPTSEAAPTSTEVDNDEAADETATPEPAQKSDSELYDKGLEKSRQTFGDRLNAFLANFRHVDEDFFDDLEETLIGADVGFNTAVTITDELRDEVKLQHAKKQQDVENVIVEKLVNLYDQEGNGEDNSMHMAASGPTVIFFVGVNGVGKTTTVGKMANMYKQQGKSVLLAAADTFRAGAIEQLQVWGKRDGVPVVALPEKSDPAAVVYDAVQRAKAENVDILMVDTAGRLQNKVNLMNELAKMKRVLAREIPDAPHEVLLVLDATTGQNALNQAKTFGEATDVTGIVLTKLDGTAKGGIVLAIRNEMHLPVKFVGLGEQVADLRPFDPNEFVYGLFKGLIKE